MTPIEKPRLSEVDNSLTMRDDTSHSPLLCETTTNENKSISEKDKNPASIRGVFFKEHISTKERQSEQDRKKNFKEQLEYWKVMREFFNLWNNSFQLNEKKRLKEEEKLREQEKQKREEERIKRDITEINKQYER